MTAYSPHHYVQGAIAKMTLYEAMDRIIEHRGGVILADYLVGRIYSAVVFSTDRGELVRARILFDSIDLDGGIYLHGERVGWVPLRSRFTYDCRRSETVWGRLTEVSSDFHEWPMKAIAGTLQSSYLPMEERMEVLAQVLATYIVADSREDGKVSEEKADASLDRWTRYIHTLVGRHIDLHTGRGDRMTPLAIVPVTLSTGRRIYVTRACAECIVLAIERGCRTYALDYAFGIEHEPTSHTTLNLSQVVMVG